MLRRLSCIDDSLGGFSWSELHGGSWVTISNDKREVKKSRLSGVAPVGWCFLKWTTWQWLDNNSGENKVSNDETAMIRSIMFQRSWKKKMETSVHPSNSCNGRTLPALDGPRLSVQVVHKTSERHGYSSYVMELSGLWGTATVCIPKNITKCLSVSFSCEVGRWWGISNSASSLATEQYV